MASNWSATSPLTTREKILLGILYGIVFTISLLPFWILYLLSDLLCLLVYDVVGYRKDVVRQNMLHSFPDKSDAERLKMERAFYHFFCDYIFETMKLATIGHKSIKKRVKFHNMENINDATRQGRGVALYLGHYCNWEWVTSIGLHLEKDALGGQIYHVLESKVMDRLMLRLRSKMGTVNIPMNEALRHMIKAKQENTPPVIGFISDQSPIIYNTPYWTEFLHQNTPFISGTERLAKKLDLRCIYLDVSRVKRGYYEVDVKVLADNPKDYPDWEITERYARAMETTIERQPPFWLWSHKRWKRRPEEYRQG